MFYQIFGKLFHAFIKASVRTFSDKPGSDDIER